MIIRLTALLLLSSITLVPPTEYVSGVSLKWHEVSHYDIYLDGKLNQSIPAHEGKHPVTFNVTGYYSGVTVMKNGRESIHSRPVYFR